MSVDGSAARIFFSKKWPKSWIVTGSQKGLDSEICWFFPALGVWKTHIWREKGWTDSTVSLTHINSVHGRAAWLREQHERDRETECWQGEREERAAVAAGAQQKAQRKSQNDSAASSSSRAAAAAQYFGACDAARAWKHRNPKTECEIHFVLFIFFV